MSSTTAATMRAKVTVQSVEPAYAGAEKLTMMPVVKDETFGPEGESENNTYSRYTPQGGLWFVITNPNLIGKFKQGDTLYVDFTPAD